jgi:hypothetical protein
LLLVEFSLERPSRDLLLSADELPLPPLASDEDAMRAAAISSKSKMSIPSPSPSSESPSSSPDPQSEPCSDAERVCVRRGGVCADGEARRARGNDWQCG